MYRIDSRMRESNIYMSIGIGPKKYAVAALFYLSIWTICQKTLIFKNLKCPKSIYAFLCIMDERSEGYLYGNKRVHRKRKETKGNH